ncbi:MAG TPA: polysaccharide lyase family protein, partial [Candidatus Angelobacter sp.]|nr:polysaccharide lyase family protein [Candidatus Angelobacter sp.]
MFGTGRIRLLLAVFLLFATGISAQKAAVAQEGTGAHDKVVWQIGEFDRSSAEFRNQGIDYSDPKSDVVYRIGKSLPSIAGKAEQSKQNPHDWPRFQPGPANGFAGGRLHPFTILFDLPEKPSGAYKLTVAILYETPRLSHLRLDVNGRAGDFYFHPKLDYGAGDWEGTFVPQTSVDTKDIEIPTQWLRQGENKFILTAVDSPDTVENSLGSIALGHTGLVYDALKLIQEASVSGSLGSEPRNEGIQATLSPTIFFRSEPDGLKNVVKATVTVGPIPPGRSTGEATLELPGSKLTQRFAASGEFGEVKLQFLVPEWQDVVEAKLHIHWLGKEMTVPFQLAAAKKWTIYVIPHEHLDIGFTDYPEKVAELHSQTIDGVLDLFSSHPDLPGSPGFRWTMDGSWVAEKYLAGRSPEKQAEFLQAVRARKITLPPQFANQHTGVASLEGLIRSLYTSAGLARQYDLPLGAAHITDVPSYSWSYASVLHDAGVKYFAAGSNSWRAPVQLLGRWNEKSPFYWEGPDGGRVLMWYSRAYLQLGTLFGTPPRLDAVEDALPVFLQAYSRPDYLANSAIIFGSQLENTALGKEQADLPTQWRARYAWPRLEFSNFAEAMKEIETQFAGKIPVYRGDFGPYWEDGFTSGSLPTAIHRGNQQRILSAEKMGVIPSIFEPSLRPDKEFLSSAWKNMLLFDEHTWTFVGATTQP